MGALSLLFLDQQGTSAPPEGSAARIPLKPTTTTRTNSTGCTVSGPLKLANGQTADDKRFNDLQIQLSSIESGQQTLLSQLPTWNLSDPRWQDFWLTTSLYPAPQRNHKEIMLSSSSESANGHGSARGNKFTALVSIA
jgi:hypothetical protein